MRPPGDARGRIDEHGRESADDGAEAKERAVGVGEEGGEDGRKDHGAQGSTLAGASCATVARESRATLLDVRGLVGLGGPDIMSSTLRYESAGWVAQILAGWLEDPSVVFVLNISGGKDSAALAILFQDWIDSGTIASDRVRRVFADTGWEADETYAHLDALRGIFGEIDTVGRPGGMLALARSKAGFPQRRGRWCTEKLKVEPLRAYFDALIVQGFEPVSVVGQRAEESEERAMLPTLEDSDFWGGWVYRPILRATVDDVILAHRRRSVPMNPLYHRGHNRVGCYPCIMEDKGGIRLIAEHAPERIDVIRGEEAAQSAERERRNASGAGHFAHERSTFFSPKMPGVAAIDDVVAWSRTERGGRNLPLFAEPPDGGCFRWGVCEAPPR